MNDDEILSKISLTQDLSCTITIDEKTYALNEVTVTKSKIPVRRPTTRGGVYFSDTTAFKVKGIVNDLSILDLIPKVMLGPNADFKPLKIKTNFYLDGVTKTIILFTHLTNTMNTKAKVELNLIIDKFELENPK